MHRTSGAGRRTHAQRGGGRLNTTVFIGATAELGIGNVGDSYLGIVGGRRDSALEWHAQVPLRRNGTLKNFYVHLWVAPGVGASWTFTVRVNGVNTALSVTIAGAATDGNDTVNQLAINARDLVCIIAVPSIAPAPADTMVTNGLEFEAGSQNFAILAGVGDTDVAAADTEYYPPMHKGAWDPTEASWQQIIPRDGQLKNFLAHLNQGNAGIGESITVTVRVNGVPTLLSVVIAGANHDAEDTGNVANVVAGDLLAIEYTTTAGIGNNNLSWNVEFYP